MNLITFREKHGAGFYQFLNTEMGRDMVATLRDSSLSKADFGLTPAEKTSNAALFLGMSNGWDNCVNILQHGMIVGEDAGAKELQATYAPDSADEVFANLVGRKTEPTIPPVTPKKPRNKK